LLSKFYVIFLFFFLCEIPCSFAENDDVKTFEGWANSLERAQSYQIKQLKSIDPAILDPTNPNLPILLVTFESFRTVLNYGISKNGWGNMDFFAHHLFNSADHIFYYSHDALKVINTEYDISTVFFPRGYTRREVKSAGQTIPKQTFFDLEGLLLGNGRLVVLYPHHISVHRPDPYYGFLTGNYELYRVNIADIKSTENGPNILSDFRGRDSPNQKFRPVLAPLGLPINEMIYPRGSGRIKVKLGLVHWTFENLKFKKYDPPLYLRDPKGMRLPADYLAYTQRVAIKQP